MQEQSFHAQPLSSYDSWFGRRASNRLEALAATISGRRVYEINSTATGGGVVELLRSQLPLMRGLNIDAHWLVLPPDERFFTITKQLHNALQGGRDSLPEDIEYYDEYSRRVGPTLPLDGDLYILHDPQTLGLIPYLQDKRVIWRCHIDLTDAEPSTYAWVRRRLSGVNRSIFSMPSFAAGVDNASIVAPSIDPLQPKNQPLSQAQASSLLMNIGVDMSRPFVTQISRYDQFKDPIGVVEMYRYAVKQLPELQLVMLGNYATDDPEGDTVFRNVKQAARDLKSALILVNIENNELIVNALQSRATAVIQYSSREGFGLTVTEAMWKRALVFTRPVGGIVSQIKDRKTGLYLTGKRESDARRIITAIESVDLRDRLGAAAHDHVQSHFITPVMVADYLAVYGEVLSGTIAATS